MKPFRSIAAIILAFVVLVSSTSFMVGMHICMGKVQNVSLFSKADGCAKEKALPPCHRHMKPDCCEDETIYHEGTDFKGSIEHIHIAACTPIDIAQPFVLIAEVIPTSLSTRLHYYYYDPPLRSCDLTVEHHVFLI